MLDYASIWIREYLGYHAEYVQCIYGCKSGNDGHTNAVRITFHSFPGDPVKGKHKRDYTMNPVRSSMDWKLQFLR